jgi:hypothetical protein
VHEDEMIVVLMTGAPAGRHRPEPRDSFNLAANALFVRLRPRAPRSVPTVFWAVRLMALGALLELAALATVVATRGDLSAAIARRFPTYSASHVQALVNGHVVSLAIGAPIVAVVWLWLAWANGRGHGWARGLFALLFILTTLSLLVALGQHAAALAPIDVIAGGALWLVALAALALIVSPRSETHYGRLSGGARRPGDIRASA